MTYTTKSPLTKTGNHFSGDQLWDAFAAMTPANQERRVRQALNRIAGVCPLLGLDEIIACAIAWIETGAAGTGLPWRSSWWLNGNNLGNLGITGDPKQNAAAQTWETPADGAMGLLAHMVAYAYGSHWRDAWDEDALGNPRVWDKRFDLVLSSTDGKPMNSLEALNNRWAVDVDRNYHGKLAERANKLVAVIKDPPVTTPSTPEEPIEGGPMALTIRQQMIPKGNRNRPGTKLNNAPLWITIHDTGNPNVGANAQMHATFVKNGGGSESVSFHGAVDDREAIQLLPCDEIGWHAGDGCDNRTTDLGCFQSFAIETCVNVDGNWARTKENLIDFCVAIIKGDSRIDFAGRKGQFSPSRIAQHNKWSGKHCPERIRNEGSWGAITNQIAAEAAGITPVDPAPETPAIDEIFPGLDLEVARRLFGVARGEDGTDYKYDPNGPVSKLWRTRGESTGEWPELTDVWVYGDGRRYFRFSDGSVVIDPPGNNTPPAWLKAEAA